jgi:hypothetical protein
MKRNIKWLGVGKRLQRWLLPLVLVGVGCHPKDGDRTPVAVAPALPLERIAIVGASVSAGFGGLPFGDAFTAAAKRSAIESEADVMLFRDPIANQRRQIDRAIAFKASTIVALDFLFWDIYGSPDPAWRDQALAAGLADLERARVAGAWILVGDVPHVVTAAEWMLAKDHVPTTAALDALDARIAAWAAGRERVLFVPFRSWAEPLAAGGEIEIAPGERVPASTLVGLDGLHANELGVYVLLDRLDKLIEAALPGTPPDALVFVRPRT